MDSTTAGYQPLKATLLKAVPMIPAPSRTSWEHAVPVGLRPDAVGGRRRATSSSFPSSGPSSQSPPV